jgi:hypothetical protein
MARVSDRAVEILALETLDVEQHVIASAHPAYRGLTRGDLRMEQARRGALLQGNA